MLPMEWEDIAVDMEVAGIIVEPILPAYSGSPPIVRVRFVD